MSLPVIQQQKQASRLKLFKLNQKLSSSKSMPKNNNNSSIPKDSTNIILKSLEQVQSHNKSCSASRQKQRKSFRDFIDSTEECFCGSRKSRKQKNLKYLLVSYDDKIKPIHYRNKTQISDRKETNQLKQLLLKQSIFKTKMHVKQGKLNRGGVFNKSQKININFNPKYFSKPISFKKMSINGKANQSMNLDWRPWTRRGERQQIQQSIRLKI